MVSKLLVSVFLTYNKVKTLPLDLFGYFHLSDDLAMFGQSGTFRAASNPDPLRLSKYDFILNSPVPSFTGKWGLKFDGTLSTALMVTYY